jgi:hypothetical protein
VKDFKREKFDVPELAYRTLLKHQRKIVERVGDRRFLKPDQITLSHVEKIFMTPESEILDALRNVTLIIQVIGFDIQEHYGPSMSDQPNFAATVRSKAEDPMKGGWEATDTRIVIDISKMMERQDEDLKKAELD